MTLPDKGRHAMFLVSFQTAVKCLVSTMLLLVGRYNHTSTTDTFQATMTSYYVCFSDFILGGCYFVLACFFWISGEFFPKL